MFDRYWNHSICRVIGSGVIDFLRLEGIVLGAVAVDDFDIAAVLFGLEAVGESVAVGE